MALTVVAEAPDHFQEAKFKGKEEAQPYAFSSPGSQPEAILEPKFDIIIKNIPKIEPTRENIPFSSGQMIHLGFNRPPKPWLPPKLIQKLDSAKRRPLKRQEMVKLIEEIAKISIDFYQVKPGEFIAIKLDGRIVDSSDSQIDLLMRIQGKKFDTQVIVWEVGSETFSGWRT